jgi:hypothetical protein
VTGQIKRLPLVRTTPPRIIEISRPIPQMTEIPAWEWMSLESPRYTGSSAPVSPVDEVAYEQYARGQFGPPAPPKDSWMSFEQYQRKHGQTAGLPQWTGAGDVGVPAHQSTQD